jgi:hypothetical protein
MLSAPEMACVYRILPDLTSGIGTEPKFEMEDSTSASSNQTPPPACGRFPTPQAKHGLWSSSVQRAELTPAPPSPQQVPVPFLIAPDFDLPNTTSSFVDSPDRRSVQSIPYGILDQCLIQELLGDVGFVTPEIGADSTAALPEAVETFDLGTNVIIQGLSKLPEFNGLRGTIQSFDHEEARFKVRLCKPSGGHKWVKVKRKNLNLNMPLPPPSFSTSGVTEARCMTPSSRDRPSLQQPNVITLRL